MGEASIAGTRLVVTRSDITAQRVDVIVNAASSTLLGGGGVDGAIHRRGGPAILEECRRLRAGRLAGGLPPGHAVSTTAGDLPAARVVHTVGPVWQGGSHGEAEVLAQAYTRVLDCVRDEGFRTVAFPSISTGAYGYPMEEAARVAISAVVAWLRAHPGTLVEVRFVQFSGDAFETWTRVLETVES